MNCWPHSKLVLAETGKRLVAVFCDLNSIPVPPINLCPKSEWRVRSCAYYRPDTERVRKWTKPGINLCLEECGFPCGPEPGRNWSWPASVIDREPYGVIAHELGHHCDWLTGEKKWEYGSEYCEQVMTESGEAAITNYGKENPAEWFAESFRLFVTNPDLLRQLRPRTHEILIRKWKPLFTENWQERLGNVPERVVKSLLNKGAKLP